MFTAQDWPCPGSCKLPLLFEEVELLEQDTAATGWVMVAYSRQWNKEKTVCTDWQLDADRKFSNVRGTNTYVYTSEGRAKRAKGAPPPAFRAIFPTEGAPSYQDFLQPGTQYVNWPAYHQAREAYIQATMTGWTETRYEVVPAKIVFAVPKSLPTS